MTFTVDNAFALVVGVGAYRDPQLAPIRAARNDAERLAALLVDPLRCAYNPANVGLLIDEGALLHQLRERLDALHYDSTPDSSLIVFFSGHGYRSEPTGTPRTELCLHDTILGDPLHPGMAEEEFSALLKAIPSRQVVVILDSCHSAGSVVLKSAAAPARSMGIGDGLLDELSHGSGRVAIASARADEYAYVRADGQQSVFSRQLLLALEGGACTHDDGLIRILDLFHFVSERVRAEQPGQTPVLKAHDLESNFAIALCRNRTGGSSPTADQERGVIRDLLVKSPVKGAERLYEYLRVRPALAERAAEAQLHLAELLRIERDVRLFGPNETERSARNRAVFALLSLFEATNQT